MGITRYGLGKFPIRNEILTAVKHCYAFVMTESGEQIQQPLVIASFVHQVIKNQDNVIS